MNKPLIVPLVIAISAIALFIFVASLFYLSGRLVQDAFKPKNVNHALTMDVKNIFSGYNTPEFRSILEKYYQDEADMEEAVRALLTDFDKEVRFNTIVRT